MSSLLLGVGQAILGLATFASEGWSDRPRRAVRISNADLIEIMIAHFSIVLGLGVVMCALAAGLATVLKSVL